MAKQTLTESIKEYQEAVNRVKVLIRQAWPRMALVLIGFAAMNAIIYIASKYCNG